MDLILCPQTSHLAGSATRNRLGTAWVSSQQAHFRREKRLKLQTHSLLSRSESFNYQSLSQLPTTKTNSLPTSFVQQVHSELSALTPKLCSVSSPSNTKSSKTIRSFGWLSSSAKRQTWTASSFYRMVPKSALPPHSVVRRRTSSLVTQ